MENILAKIQSLLKVPKTNENKFGGYKFRSAEDILEAVKIIANPLGFYCSCTDSLVLLGDKVYVKGTAILSDGTTTYTADGYAREEEILKGMQAAQITGAASSYARKYALNGLFAIDDTKDADAINKHEDKVVPQKTDAPKTPKPEPKKEEVKKPWLNPNTPEWTNTVELIKKGLPIDQALQFFLISKANRTKLETETKTV